MDDTCFRTSAALPCLKLIVEIMNLRTNNVHHVVSVLNFVLAGKDMISTYLPNSEDFSGQTRVYLEYSSEKVT